VLTEQQPLVRYSEVALSVIMIGHFGGSQPARLLFSSLLWSIGPLGEYKTKTYHWVPQYGEYLLLSIGLSLLRSAGLTANCWPQLPTW